MITIYTTSTCAWCPMVERYLKSKGADYIKVNLEDEPEIREEIRKKTGAMTVPITFIGDEFVIGWNPGKLAELLK